MLQQDFEARLVSNAEIVAQQEEVDLCLESVCELESEIYQMLVAIEENKVYINNLITQSS